MPNINNIPPDPIFDTSANRIAANVLNYRPWQLWNETDTGLSYYLNGRVWVNSQDQANLGIDMDGRGTLSGMIGGVRVNNQDTNTTLLIQNASRVSGAIVGLVDRAIGSLGTFIGMAMDYSFDTLSIIAGSINRSTFGFWHPVLVNTFRTVVEWGIVYVVPGDIVNVKFLLGWGDQTNSGQARITANVDTGSYQNTGGSETDAFTYTLPANSLMETGEGIHIYASGNCAANVNNKRARITFGATTIVDTTTGGINGIPWEMEARVYRTGPTTQRITGRATVQGIVSQIKNATAAEDLTTNINIITKLTGVATSDITQTIHEVEVIN